MRTPTNPNPSPSPSPNPNPNPSPSPSPNSNPNQVPRGFSDADNWQLLLWAALLCAQDWHRAQTTGSVEAASRYQETTRSP